MSKRWLVWYWRKTPPPKLARESLTQALGTRLEQLVSVRNVCKPSLFTLASAIDVTAQRAATFLAALFLPIVRE
jgi:hypothetical protein